MTKDPTAGSSSAERVQDVDGRRGEAGPAGSVSAARIASLPKVELHVHLEGTISAVTAAGLAHSRGEDPHSVLILDETTGELRYPRPFRDFMHFVDTFLASSAQIRVPADLVTVAAAFAHGQAEQGVRWSETTFTAVTMERRGWDAEAMWSALAEGFASEPSTAIGLILDTPRDLGVDAARRCVGLATSALAAGVPVVALGLTGIEGSVPIGEFMLLRDAADELGIGLVAHAGEMGGPNDVAEAIDVLGSDRIGHGIAAVHDPQLLARVAAEGIVFEICPSSNVTLGIVASLEEHPIRRLRDAGVAITVNSDDPPFFSTSLSQELAHAVRLLDLDEPRLAALQRRAIDASFAPDALRAEVHAAVDDWLAGR